MSNSPETEPLSSRQRWYREVYLRSDHWRTLRAQKLSLSPVCEDCAVAGNLDVHHVVYRDLASVTVDCLRTLCRSCHELRHARRSVAERQARTDAICALWRMKNNLKSVRRQHRIDVARRRHEEAAAARAEREARRVSARFKAYALHCLEDVRNGVASPKERKFLRSNHHLIARMI